MLMAAGSSWQAGTTGGAAYHTLTVQEMPAHDHSATETAAGAHAHNASTGSAGAHAHSGSALEAGAHAHNASTGTAGSHDHASSMGTAGDHSHTGSTNDAGIMRTRARQTTPGTTITPERPQPAERIIMAHGARQTAPPSAIMTVPEITVVRTAAWITITPCSTHQLMAVTRTASAPPGLVSTPTATR